MFLIECLIFSSSDYRAPMHLSDYDYSVLHKTIYLEARGECTLVKHSKSIGSHNECEQGQQAVAHAILNRARANRDYWGGSSVAGEFCQRQMEEKTFANDKKEN